MQQRTIIQLIAEPEFLSASRNNRQRKWSTDPEINLPGVTDEKGAEELFLKMFDDIDKAIGPDETALSFNRQGIYLLKGEEDGNPRDGYFRFINCSMFFRNGLLIDISYQNYDFRAQFHFYVSETAKNSFEMARAIVKKQISSGK